MSERDDDIEFDFFDDEPETEQATQRRPALRPRPGPRPPVGVGPRRTNISAPQGFTPILRLVLLIALRRRSARLLAPELPRAEPRERVPRLHRGHVRRRAVVRRDRGRPQPAADDAGDPPGRPDHGDRGAHAPPGAGRCQRPAARPARAAPRGARRCDPGAPVQGQRAERARDRLRRDRRRASGRGRRRVAGHAGRASRRQRRDLGRPVQGSRAPGAREPGHR